MTYMFAAPVVGGLLGLVAGIPALEARICVRLRLFASSWMRYRTMEMDDYRQAVGEDRSE